VLICCPKLEELLSHAFIVRLTIMCQVAYIMY
jgi:hypothetical protein